MTRIHGHKLGPPVRKLLIVGIGLLSFLLSTITDAGDLPLVQRDAIAISGAADIPVRLEVADLDGDDQLDVIAANESDDKILWYRNTGGSPPAFEPLITAYLPSRGNEWVDAADVDGDGDTDLFYAVSAVHSVSSDAFGWMENAAGDASEWVEHRIADGMANSWAIEAADIDGDSDLDAFFAVEDDGVLGWFENLNGTGTQWAAHTFDTNAPGVRAIRVKDIDGDGDPDLVAAVFDINTAAWYANNVTNGGSFVRHELFNGLNGAYDLDVQDLDGDTDPDIVVVANTSGQIVWFQNDGSTSPVFAIHPFPSFVTAPTSVSIGDLDGDTNADIVVGLELPDDEILWFESDGSATPTFTEHTMEAFSNGRTISLLAVDIDQDSDTDLLAGFIFGIQLFHNDSTDPVAWVLSDVDTDAFGDELNMLVAGDIDRDGDLDLVTAGDNIIWYTNRGDGTFSPGSVHAAASAVRCVDVDRDGDLDLLKGTSWLENNGTATPLFTNEHVISGSGVNFDLGDLDGDGDVDLVTVGADVIRRIENQGGSPPVFQAFDAALLEDVGLVRTSDLDSDGDVDFVAWVRSAFVPEKIVYFENAGTIPPLFVERPVRAEVASLKQLIIHDMNADGLPDIVYGKDRVGAGDPARFAWEENLGGSPLTFTQRTIETGDHLTGMRSIMAGDCDLDGDTDLAVTTLPFFGDHVMLYYEGDGAAMPSFTRRTVPANHRDPIGVLPVDLDNDGDIDWGFVSNGDEQLGWLENRTIHRSAFYPTSHPVETLGGRSDCLALDLNGDHALDLLVASEGSEALVVYLNDGSGPQSAGKQVIDAGAGIVVTVDSGDLNSDGTLDAVAGFFGADVIAWYDNVDGAATSWVKRVIASLNGPRDVVVADINRDGRQDVVYAASEIDTVGWLENLGGQPPAFSNQVIRANIGGALAVAVADFDGDGRLDVAAGGKANTDPYWYMNDVGAGDAWPDQRISFTATTGWEIGAGDIDRDGTHDIVVADRTADLLTLYRHDGSGPTDFEASI